MDGRKRLSGSQYRKKRAEKESEAKRAKFSLRKYLLPSGCEKQVPAKSSEEDSATASPSADSPPLNAGPLDIQSYVGAFSSDCLSDAKEEDNVDVDSGSEEDNTIDGHDSISGEHAIIDCDPGKWPNKINDFVRTTLVKRGTPPKLSEAEAEMCPKDNSNRRFTTKNYRYYMCNGESVERKWLVYSKTKNSVFCFCCKLFSTATMSFTVNGYSNWHNISEALSSHGKSPNHLQSQKQWVELSIRLGSGSTIDENTQRILNTETRHWKNVIERIIAIVQFLAQQCLPFRGDSDKLFEHNNGNFLKLVELFGRFDLVLQEHIRRTTSGKNKSHHYLGKNIQNEIIQLLQDQIKNKILSALKAAKYYSIILDCTPDISGVEQMTIIVRFVDFGINAETVKIKEHFLGFIPIIDSTGLGLTEVLLQQLQEMGIPIENMRGQGYDNGSNMKGKNLGVQNRILQINPKAFYVPCSSHSLNLVVNDAAKASEFAVSFFSLVSKIYIFFSASTSRWAVLKRHISSLTLKPLCETRWESRIDAITPFRYKVEEIYDALMDISEAENTDKMVAHEATSLANLIRDYTFLCSIVIWYDILLHINVVSKTMQNIDMEVSKVINLLEDTEDYFKSVRNDFKFQGYLTDAKELASKLDMEEPKIGGTTRARRRKAKRQFDYEAEDESSDLEPETLYKINFYFKVLDTTIAAISARFEQVKDHSEVFDFLYDISKIKEMSHDDLSNKCTKLCNALTDGESKDISFVDLRDELKVLSTLLKPNSSPLETLKFIKEFDFAPNVSVALRILLTLPITVASGERSFSKLKLIKTYLRSTMSQSRLSGLATISIEHQVAESLDYKDLLHEFASIKARKVIFN